MVMVDIIAKGQDISEDADIMGGTGQCIQYQYPAGCGIETADILIAVTGSDELNLLYCCLIAKVSKCHTLPGCETPYTAKRLGLSKSVSRHFP